MGLFSKNSEKYCPICGGTAFYGVGVGRAETWHAQVEQNPQWKVNRGLPPGAGVAFSDPRLEWDQPTFDRVKTPTPHLRCARCASLVPPQFLTATKSKVLLITAGMPQAGKTTWLRCLFNPSSRRHLVAEPTNLIARDPYPFVEPYTIANPDPRTAIPILLHGMTLTFERLELSLAGVDVKGEVFRQQREPDKYMRVLGILKNLRAIPFSELLVMFVVPFDPTLTREHIGQAMSHLVKGEVFRQQREPDKYMRVLGILKNLRAIPFSELLVMFVVPFDPTLTREHIGQAMSHLGHRPGSRGTWQGVIWTHLDRAELRDAEGLLAFLQSSEPALALAKRAVEGSVDLFDRHFMNAATDIERLVRNTRVWNGQLAVLESLTWLLYRLMLAYTVLPDRFGIGKVEFYYQFKDGLGGVLVRQVMRLAANLFAAWDGAGRGDFAAMIREAMKSGTDLQFPVLPCGIEFLEGAAEDDGLPVWGDLLLLEILRRHA